MRIALLHEHPTWSLGLLDRARERGLDLTPVDIGAVALSSAALDADYDLWVNRVNAMPSAGRPASIVAATGHLLTALELRGRRVLNGSTTHRIGGSKAAQAALFNRLGLNTPPTAGIFRAEDAVGAAHTIGFPVLTKPNVGGSGSGIMRHDTPQDLHAAIENETVELGIDGTGVVQRVIDSADGMIYRVEMLGDEFFYGTTQPLRSDAFNYCAADGCAMEAEGAAIELFTPPPKIIESVSRVMVVANTQVGGIEYIIDSTTGEPSFFDFNPYSNFVTGFDDDLGFDPNDRYLDFVLAHAALA